MEDKAHCAWGHCAGLVIIVRVKIIAYPVGVCILPCASGSLTGRLCILVVRPEAVIIAVRAVGIKLYVGSCRGAVDLVIDLGKKTVYLVQCLGNRRCSPEQGVGLDHLDDVFKRGLCMGLTTDIVVGTIVDILSNIRIAGVEGAAVHCVAIVDAGGIFGMIVVIYRKPEPYLGRKILNDSRGLGLHADLDIKSAPACDCQITHCFLGMVSLIIPGLIFTDPHHD